MPSGTPGHLAGYLNPWRQFSDKDRRLLFGEPRMPASGTVSCTSPMAGRGQGSCLSANVPHRQSGACPPMRGLSTPLEVLGELGVCKSRQDEHLAYFKKCSEDRLVTPEYLVRPREVNCVTMNQAASVIV